MLVLLELRGIELEERRRGAALGLMVEKLEEPD